MKRPERQVVHPFPVVERGFVRVVTAVFFVAALFFVALALVDGTSTWWVIAANASALGGAGLVQLAVNRPNVPFLVFADVVVTLWVVGVVPDVPADELNGVRVTTLGRRVYADSLTRREDPSGREYFWIGGGVSRWSGRDDSDFRAVQAGYVSVTPLHLDLTNYRLISEVRSWMLGG